MYPHHRPSGDAATAAATAVSQDLGSHLHPALGGSARGWEVGLRKLSVLKFLQRGLGILKLWTSKAQALECCTDDPRSPLAAHSGAWGDGGDGWMAEEGCPIRTGPLHHFVQPKCHSPLYAARYFELGSLTHPGGPSPLGVKFHSPRQNIDPGI